MKSLLIVSGGMLSVMTSCNPASKDAGTSGSNESDDASVVADIVAAQLEAQKEAERRDSLRQDSIRKDSIERVNRTTPDLVFNELHGMVKTCSGTRGQYNGSYNLNYDKDGNWTNPGRFHRDAQGRIGSETVQSDMEGTFTGRYAWDADKVVKYTCPFWTDSFEYGTDGFRSRKVTTHKESEGYDGGEKEVTKYSNYKFDDKGNWIKRSVKGPWESYVETRRITYYE